MSTNVKIDTELWGRFIKHAHRKRKQPNRLLETVVAEYLTIQKDLHLDEEIGKRARSSGFRETNAVELVKEYRREKAT